MRVPWKRLRLGTAGLLAVGLVAWLVPWSELRRPQTATIDAPYDDVVQRMEEYCKGWPTVEVRRVRGWGRYEYWSQVNWWHGIRVIVEFREQRRQSAGRPTTIVKVRTFADNSLTPSYSVFGERYPETEQEIIARLEGNVVE